MSLTYDLASTVLIVGGIDVSGFGADGAIEFEYAGDLTEDIVGADGSVIIARSNDMRMYCTITLLQNSKAYKALAGLMQDQEGDDEFGDTPTDFYMYDQINGDRISEEIAVFKTRPLPNKAKTPDDRAFTLILPYAADRATARFGELIA